MTSLIEAPSQLLLLSLGPIQDFIASARRCQDLWYGSWLLSDLARATAESLEREAKATLVFPGALGNDKQNVANKVLAVVPGDAAAARKAALAAEAAMRLRLDEVAQEVFAPIWEEPDFHRDVAMKQLADLIEVFWAAVPLVKPTDYATAREEAEAALAEVKNTRLWGPVTWTTDVAGVPKSSLDGLRESVIDERLYDRLLHGALAPERARRTFGIRATERLCGVGLLKRRGVELDEAGAARRRQPAFHSTSHVAAAPLLCRLEGSPRAQAAFRSYVDTLRGLGVDLPRFRVRAGTSTQAHFTNPFVGSRHSAARVFPESLDGQLLYESRLESVLDTRAEMVDEVTRRSNLDQARRALRRVTSAVGTPCNAYVLLLADGDNMGRRIDELARERGLDGHQHLSAALDGFATQAASAVSRHGGSLIYSGGDDVLAMLPLHGALACARELHDAFGKAVSGATLSIGLAVVHHLEPFGEARRWAKEAEGLAKALPGKDALGIIVVPRSGAETRFAAPWSKAPDAALQVWMNLLGWQDISSKAAHDLASMLEPLKVGLRPEPRGELREVVSALARRVLAAKRQGGGQARLRAENRELLEDRFLGVDDPFRAVEQLIAELLVAQALLDGAYAAFGRPRGEQQAHSEVRA